MANHLTKLKPKRRWLQVSLRTVLMLVTLLCVALAVWVVPAERQRRAVAAIEALGGTVTFIDSQTRNESSAKAFLRRWLPQAYVDEVGIVNLADAQVTDAGLAHLKGLTSLQMLDLSSTQVTDAGVANLEDLTALQWMTLHNTQITDAALPHLKRLTALQELWLNGTQVTDDVLAQLRKALPNCRIHGP